MDRNTNNGAETMTTRTYPSCCTSAFCGRTSCDGCPNKPTLDDFKSWVEANNAAPADPIWSPNVYVTNAAASD